MLTTMTSQGQASQAGCKTPYGSSPQRSARTSITVLASLVQAALFFVCPCCLVPSHRHASEAPPPPSSPLKLPAIPGQGGQGQEQSGSRSTPGKAKGAPTMTAPTMAAPTANNTHTPYCIRTSAKPAETAFITESPLQQLGGAGELWSTLRYKRPPPLEEGQTTKADGAPLVCEFSYISFRCNSDPIVGSNL